MAAVLKLKQSYNPTIGDLCNRFLQEVVGKVRDYCPSTKYSLIALAASELGKKSAVYYETSDIVAHCTARQAAGAGPATITQDLVHLVGPLKYARWAWGYTDVRIEPLKDAKALLTQMQVIGKARVRDRRPSEIEFDMLMEFYRVQNEHARTEIPMDIIMEFAVWSLKRISEICRLKWVDYNAKDATCTLRDMKDPRQKKGNDFTFPLLGRALELVKAQPRLDPNDPTERIFPYNAKSAGARNTRACISLGIRDLHFHDLRREGICRMFEAGYGPQEVAAVSGHKNWAILARVYANKFNPVDLHKGPAALRALEAKRAG